MLADVFTSLSTDRLLLRPLNADDAAAIFALHSNEEVQRYLSRERMSNPRASRIFINKINEGVTQSRWFYWGICLKEAPTQLMGTICLWQFTEQYQKAEIGFDLHPDFQKQGLMSEAASAVIHFAKSRTQLTLIEAIAQAENVASRKLLQAVGFSFSHYLSKDEKFSQEQEVELCVYQRQL